jgi:hypothetical protein
MPMIAQTEEDTPPHGRGNVFRYKTAGQNTSLSTPAPGRALM